MSIKHKHIKHSASLVAKYFVWKANTEKKPITNKKLQKLLYYAQAWHLVFYDAPLFAPPIEAWVHGPAVRSLYGQYRRFGFDPIEEKISETDLVRLDTEDRELLDEIWSLYGGYDAEYLERLAHHEDPWRQARNGLDLSDISDNVINHESMKTYFSKVLEDAEAEEDKEVEK